MTSGVLVQCSTNCLYIFSTLQPLVLSVIHGVHTFVRWIKVPTLNSDSGILTSYKMCFLTNQSKRKLTMKCLAMCVREMNDTLRSDCIGVMCS